MTTSLTTPIRVSASEVRETLSRHMLVDGYRHVQDLEKSHGIWFHDAARGRDVLDFYGHFSSCPIGYNHPKLATPEFRDRILPAALTKPANSDVYTTQLAEFVETFARTVPERFRKRLFFIEGGSAAVENALKTAFDWKVRKNLAAGRGERGSQIIHFRQAFHGRGGYTLSLTNTADPRKTDYFPKFPWPRITNPKLRFPVTAEVTAEVERLETRAVAEIEHAVGENPHDIAALLVEPIQGEGGDNHFRAEFLRKLRRLADEHEFLLIFDEVQTGFGTTGRWWSFEHFGVEPDIFVFAKKTQVCGIAAGPRVDEVDSVFKISSRINSTWGGNLVDMIRCQRIIEIIEEDDLIANAARVGDRLLGGLRRLETLWPGQVDNARGRGLFAAIDLPTTEIRNRTLSALVESDVLGLASGERAIRMRPPLVITAEEVDEGVRRVEAALRKILG
ncbi:MAG TPA: L-lysine 6-transaminase [Thermoanaerobaculia bacterium]|nr:L-lysine 6-transaminase [Thermoanaerobaculia bacterium]